MKDTHDNFITNFSFSLGNEIQRATCKSLNGASAGFTCDSLHFISK